jgi:hypothetical protein
MAGAELEHLELARVSDTRAVLVCPLGCTPQADGLGWDHQFEGSQP